MSAISTQGRIPSHLNSVDKKGNHYI